MSNHASNTLLFSGEVRHALDPKNRVTIPARWRSEEMEEFFVVRHSQQACLVAMPPDVFEKVGKEAEQKAPSAAEYRKFITKFYSSAARCVLDKQGRLLLPLELCQNIGLRGELVLAGSLDRFEIWSPETLAAYRETIEPAYQLVADLVGI